MRDGLLFLHIVGVAGWLGGLGAFLVSAILGATIGKRNSERLIEAANTGVGDALRSWRVGTVWDFVISRWSSGR